MFWRISFPEKTQNKPCASPILRYTKTMKQPIEPFQIDIITSTFAAWIKTTEEVKLAKDLTDDAIGANTNGQFNDAVDKCEAHEVEAIALEARTRGQLLGLMEAFNLKPF